MATTTSQPPAPPLPLSAKPSLDRVDAFGLTHAGLRRTENADHFIVASFHRGMRVHSTSLDPARIPPLSFDSRGYLMLVADGVGGLVRAREGSAYAADAIARLLLEMGEVTYPLDAAAELTIVARLRAFVTLVHEQLRDEFERDRTQAATTITIALAMWPRSFVVHVGDSRCYRLRDGRLERLTTDHTLAQAFIDAGALKPDAPAVERLKHTLVSAIGSAQLEIQVVTDALRLTDRWLLCTDGLTRHVADEEIAERLAGPGDSEAICRGLLQLALQRGGADNIAITAGRIRDV
jgi:protein phosphatase